MKVSEPHSPYNDPPAADEGILHEGDVSYHPEE